MFYYYKMYYNVLRFLLENKFLNLNLIRITMIVKFKAVEESRRPHNSM